MSLLLDVQNLAVGESANFVSFVSTMQTAPEPFWDSITVYGVKVEMISEEFVKVTSAYAVNYRRGSYGYLQALRGNDIINDEIDQIAESDPDNEAYYLSEEFFREYVDSIIRDNPSMIDTEDMGVDVDEMPVSELMLSFIEDGEYRELLPEIISYGQLSQALFVSLSDFGDFLIDAEQELLNTEWINSVCNWMRGEG